MSDPWGQHNPYQPPPGYGAPHQPGYGPQPPPGHPQGYWSRPPGADGYAVASLVLGILCFFSVTAILAVVFGHMALDRINHSGQEGRGMAIAGLILGYTWTALLLIGAIALIADS